MSTQVEMVAEAIGEEHEQVAPVEATRGLDKALVAQLVGEAQASGLGIDGENGLLAQGSACHASSSQRGWPR